MPTCSCWAVFALRLLLRQPSARGKRHSGHLASTSSCGKVDELKIEVHFSYFGIEVGSFSSPPSLLTKCCEVPQLLDCAMCPAGGASEKNKPVYQWHRRSDYLKICDSGMAFTGTILCADTSSNSALGNKWSSYIKSEGLRDVFQGKIHPRLPTRHSTVGGVVIFSQVLKFIYSFSPGILEFAAHISTLKWSPYSRFASFQDTRPCSGRYASTRLGSGKRLS